MTDSHSMAIQQSEDGIDRVMVDIETLGLTPGSSILSIGAVRFGTDALTDGFYREINLQSCEKAGLEIDDDTLEWWLDQDEDVQDVLTGGEDLGLVLQSFGSFYGDADEIWAYSPSFDCAHLAHAYDALGMEKPWTYRDERDCRTLASLPIWPDSDQKGNEHNALDDAMYQARLTERALRTIQGACENE